jgi:hypothetical protein
MACPYFCPTQRLQAAGWRGRIRPPLGDLYEGECHARPKEINRPGGAVLIEGCNYGYAASQCGRFPGEGAPDAVRFCVHQDLDGRVRIDYVLERAHLPHEHGRVVFDRATKAWAGLRAGSLLERQAQAYLESYLAWKDGDAAARQSQTAAENGLAAEAKA